MTGERFNRKLRGNIFTQRVVSIWNELPVGVVGACTITTFKRHLDRLRGKWVQLRLGILVGMNRLAMFSCCMAL